MNASQLREYQATLNNDAVASERKMIKDQIVQSIHTYPHQKYTCIWQLIGEATIQSLIADQYKVERGNDSDRGYQYSPFHGKQNGQHLLPSAAHFFVCNSPQFSQQ